MLVMYLFYKTINGKRMSGIWQISYEDGIRIDAETWKYQNSNVISPTINNCENH